MKKAEKALWAAYSAFFKAFNYFPNMPNEVNYGDEAYTDILERSIRDKVDYTTVFPGETPEEKLKRRGYPDSDIIYD